MQLIFVSLFVVYACTCVALFDCYTSQFDSAFGEYTPWSTGEGSKLSELDKSLTSDKLNQSHVSATLDEMVSQIIDDDPNSDRYFTAIW